MKQLFKLFFIIIFIANITAGTERSVLEKLGKQYVTFMQSVGGDIATYEAQASEIFADNVIKIVNDKQILSDRAGLLAQLQRNREIAYPCTFTVQKILCDTNQKACTVHFTWNSQKKGQHKTIVSLKFNENNQITEIDAVYNTSGTDLHPVVNQATSPLEDLGKRLINFMGALDQLSSNEGTFTAQVEALFSENVSKIVNGKTILTNRLDLIKQLKDAKEKAFPCTFEIKKIACIDAQRICIISFTWNSQKMGEHSTMVFLKFDENNQITEIDEVYNASGVHLSSPKKSIADLARRYSEFQQSYGQSENKDYPAIIEGLFSPGFQKIVNREVKVDSRDALEPQLKGVRDAVTSWTIEVKEIIPSADNKKCAVRFVLKTPSAGSYDVLKVLSSENGETIDKVDEVFDVIK